MKRKSRLFVYAVVALLIPIGIYILFPEDWRQTLPWIGFVAVVATVYEVITKKK